MPQIPDLDIVLEEVNRRLPRTQTGEAGRLFHGRGECFENLNFLNIDHYAPVCAMQVFAPTEPVWLELLAKNLADVLPADSCILVQDRTIRGSEWRVLHGELPEECVAREDGLTYQLTFLKNQNIGFFPDMRLGRQRARELAKGARVLNLFAYTCSFSNAALAGGAASVINVDVAKGPLKIGQRNHAHNNQGQGKASFWPRDVLKTFGRFKRSGPFDLVIIDPPTFQKNSFQAARDYPRICRRLPEMLADGARVLACLNAPQLGVDYLREIFDPTCFEEEDVLYRPEDFPEQEPDRGLKIVQFRYRGVVQDHADARTPTLTPNRGEP